MPGATTTTPILQEFLAERRRQDERHGGTTHDDQNGPHDWIALVCKHAGLGVTLPPDTLGMALDRFRKQMVSVGALSMAAIEWTDREIARLTVIPPNRR